MKGMYHRALTMSKTYIVVIRILFHGLRYRCLMHFLYSSTGTCAIFTKITFYGCFVKLKNKLSSSWLCLLIKKNLLDKCIVIGFIDSAPLLVCKNPRTHIHMAFMEIVQNGRVPWGYLLFKLYLISN